MNHFQIFSGDLLSESSESFLNLVVFETFPGQSVDYAKLLVLVHFGGADTIISTGSMLASVGTAPIGLFQRYYHTCGVFGIDCNLCEVLL